MKGSKILIAIILVLSITQLGFGLDLTKINMSYQYDLKADIRFKYRVIKQQDLYTVFYELKSDKSKEWKMNLITQSGYQNSSHDTLTNYVIDSLRIWPGRLTARLDFKLSSEDDLLLFTFQDSIGNSQYIFDISLDIAGGFPDFYPVDVDGLPVLDSYISAEIAELNSDTIQFHVYQYSHEFKGADPAMGQMQVLAPTLAIDTSFFFQSSFGDLRFNDFYLLQKDTLDQKGVTLLKVPSYYPKSKRIEELIGPLQYITTDSENKSLNSGVDSKRVFEQFWINTYGSKFLAKEAIRAYYRKVEESNMLFTDYKNGWKTDRGMLYIIFGIPNEVIRTESSEVWKYSDELEFEFIRFSTLFAPSFYSLRRNLKYEDVWYNRVGNIRNE